MMLSSILSKCTHHPPHRKRRLAAWMLSKHNNLAVPSVWQSQEKLVDGGVTYGNSGGNSNPPVACFSTYQMQSERPRQTPCNIVSGGKVQLSGPIQVDSVIRTLIEDLQKSAQFNQGKGGNVQSRPEMWDVDFVKDTVQRYEDTLKSLYLDHKEALNNPNFKPLKQPSASLLQQFFSADSTTHAFRAMLRCKLPTQELATKVRLWEKYIGTIGRTTLTDDLSLRMIEANGKAGNVGRVVSLLAVRKSRDYTPTSSEFIFAVTAIEAAGLSLRIRRNVFLPDADQPKIDDPTRWLDAILLNMSQRNFRLTTKLANRMLNTYATTGKTGKATHFFYKVSRAPIGSNYDGSNDVHDDSENDAIDRSIDGQAQFQGRPVRVKLTMRPPPPYHKIPSQVRGKLVRKPGTDIKQLKLDRESDPDWSPPLTAAVAFADSLKQGACGHEPIELDLISYSTLMKVCVNRGSLWRAMHILDEIMPANDIEPDVIAYNTLLQGLSRVGDVPTMQQYYNQMISKDIQPTKETIGAIVDGLLNLGDVAAAITVVQDSFNQHSVLPPYTTHLKILEFALGSSLVYEAKRHVYFIQQLWKWQPNEYHSDEFRKLMELTKRNPKLSREALEKLFAYFGEKLDDKDFF